MRDRPTPHSNDVGRSHDEIGEPLLVDVFDADAARGAVIGTSSTTGAVRHGADDERSLSIDHGALRLRPATRPGWGRSALRYGPWAVADGVVLSASLTNGRNASTDATRWPTWSQWGRQWLRGTQSDPPPVRLVRSLRFPRRDAVGRRLRTAWADGRRPDDDDRSDLSLAFGWCRDPATPLDGVAFVVRRNRAGYGELCLAERGSVRVLGRLREIPMRLALVAAEGRCAAFVSFDDTAAQWPDLQFLATSAVGVGDGPMWATLDQRVVGEVGFGADTRVHEVRIDRLATPPSLAALARVAPVVPTTAGPAAPTPAPTSELVVADDFTVPQPVTPSAPDAPDADPADLADRDADPDDLADPADLADLADLAGRPIGDARWRHVIGRRRIVTGPHGAVVGPPVDIPIAKLHRVVAATGQRTAYVVDWPGGPGVVEADLIPPGDGPGQDARGRGGLILYQDDDNYLIVNDWVDDGHEPAVCAFRRIRGYEEVFDGLWTNVDGWLTWGQRHTLRLTFDERGFRLDLDARTVLARRMTDLYPAAPPLVVRAVGICANWDFGDDSGSRFVGFAARRLR